MKLIELFNEARKHAPNTKRQARTSTDNELKVIAEKYGTDDIFITFTNVDKFGVNPQTTYNTPVGLYAYPLEYVRYRGIERIPFAAGGNYIWVFRNNFSDENTWNLSEDVSDPVFYENFVDAVRNTTGQFPRILNITNRRLWYFMYDAVEQAGMKKSTTTHKILKNLGLYAIIDSGEGIIHKAEPTQSVFLNTSKLQVLDKINNQHKNSGYPAEPKFKEEPPQPEKYLNKNSTPQQAYLFALKKGRRIPKYEKLIASDPTLAFLYFHKIINKGKKEGERHQRWPEAEATIDKDPIIAKKYDNLVRGLSSYVND